MALVLGLGYTIAAICIFSLQVLAGRGEVVCVFRRGWGGVGWGGVRGVGWGEGGG